MKNSISNDCFKSIFFVIIFCGINFFLSTSVAAQYPAGSPVAINGKLKVSGTQLVNQCGNAVQLRGMSSAGLQYFPQCYNNSSLSTLAKDWGIDVFRLAMYVDEGGYLNNPSYWKTYIDSMVTECGKLGIYCVIDWHILNPGDPNAHLSDAENFWSYMSAKHAADKHVLYEICNEPNGVSWSTVKTYANDIIPRIRAYDPSTIIIVGTPTYSQDVDVASTDKLTYSNIMYALHFYSGTHMQSLRDKGNTAIANGAALFVTECGTSTASGDGDPYLTEMQTWIDWMASNKISWINWNYADKSETSSALTSGACANADWNNTSASGTFIKQKILSPADNFICGKSNTPPVVSITAPGNETNYTAPATIAIKANASDADGSIKSVKFYNGNTPLRSDTTSPYSYTWSNVSAGTYKITALATDNNGAVTTSSAISVTVKSTSNKIPTVAITSPANGASYTAPATITLKATASDTDGTIKSVTFYNGSTALRKDTISPYSYVWSNVGSGTYSITARATDNEGAVKTSAAISITVKGGTANSNLKIQYKTPDAGATTNTLRPWLQIANNGTAAVNLSELKIRYWFTNDGAAAQNFYCDWSAVGCGNIQSKFVNLTGTVTGANNYLELSFTTGLIAANSNSGEIQDRIAKSDWSNYTQTNDYSFDGAKTNYADWNKVTLYRNNVLVWGTEPSGYTTSNVSNTTTDDTNKELALNPNPSGSYTDLYYSSLIKQQANIFVLNTISVKQLELTHTMNAGLNKVRLDLSALNAGTYYVSVAPLNGKAVVKKLVVIR